MDGNDNIVDIVTKEMQKNAEAPAEVTAAALKFPTIKVGKREIPLAYTLRTQIRIEEDLEMTYDELRENVNQLKGNRNTKTTIRTLRILGNAGLERAGKEADLTEEWLTDHIVPKDMLAYKVAILQTLFAGRYMETENSEDGEVDIGLMEIRKKKESTD